MITNGECDMDKWRKVFYDDEGTKLNYKFPKILSKDSEYFSAVLQFMDTLIKDLSDNGIEKAFIEIAMEYRELIKDVLTNYYSGDIVLAYTMIEQLIKEYKSNGIIFSKLSKSYSFNYYVIENKKWDNFLFYRARIGDISNENKKDTIHDVKAAPNVDIVIIVSSDHGYDINIRELKMSYQLSAINERG